MITIIIKGEVYNFLFLNIDWAFLKNILLAQHNNMKFHGGMTKIAEFPQDMRKEDMRRK